MRARQTCRDRQRQRQTDRQRGGPEWADRNKPVYAFHPIAFLFVLVDRDISHWQSLRKLQPLPDMHLAGITAATNKTDPQMP